MMDEKPLRVIGLLDMDCFECQIYQLEKPKTLGKPCVAANSRGRIVSVNYEAKKSGISRSIRVPAALKLCPKLQVLEIPERFGKPDSSKLRHASERVLDTIKEYCQNHGQNTVLEYSPHDEFYLDITEDVQLKIPMAWTIWYLLNGNAKAGLLFLLLIGMSICCVNKLIEDWLNGGTIHYPWTIPLTFSFFAITKEWNKLKVEVPLDYGKHFMSKLCQEVKRKTKMTDSAGVSTNKFRAKLASSENKPNGVFALNPDDFDTFILEKKIAEVPGLKSGLGEKIYEHFKIKTMKELQKIHKADLLAKLDANETDKIGNILTGHDDEPVVAKEFSRAINCGKTFPSPNQKHDSIFSELKKGRYGKVLKFLVLRIFEWICSFFKWTVASKAEVKRGGKVEKVLLELSKEMIERLTEEKSRNNRETNDLAVKIVYFTDPSDPNSQRSEMRTFKFNFTAGWNGISKQAVNKIKWTTQFDEQKMWITEVNLIAKNWFAVSDHI